MWFYLYSIVLRAGKNIKVSKMIVSPATSLVQLSQNVPSISIRSVFYTAERNLGKHVIITNCCLLSYSNNSSWQYRTRSATHRKDEWCIHYPIDLGGSVLAKRCQVSAIYSKKKLSLSALLSAFVSAQHHAHSFHPFIRPSTYTYAALGSNENHGLSYCSSCCSLKAQSAFCYFGKVWVCNLDTGRWQSLLHDCQGLNADEVN